MKTTNQALSLFLTTPILEVKLIMPSAKTYNVLFVDQSENHPNPLPTPNDIDGSESVVHESTGSHLIRVQQRFLVKFGIHVHPIEGYNMLYVAKYTTVPIPKVYAIYQCQEEQRIITYILMQYIPGTTLLDLWGSLDRARKTAITLTLRTYFDQLRQLQPPGVTRAIWLGIVSISTNNSQWS
ncbi:hypothetical protein F4806DRAFT_84465 [Annulohypoxylon nitens]|nr:hypothetical protein F4806DRAFT_84465 [Annulohypoxylon nitens]